MAVALIWVAALLYFIPITGYERDYDEGVYWQSLRAMAAGHPLFTSVFSSQPPYFLLSIYPFYMAFGQSIVAARVGVALFALVGLVAMYWLASMVGGRWAGLIALAVLVIDPQYLHEAQTLQAEGPAVAVEILSVALAVAAWRSSGRWRAALALLAGVALAYGTLIKLLAVVALVPMALYLAAPLLRACWVDGRLTRPPRTALIGVGRDLGLLMAGAASMLIVGLVPFVGRLGLIWDQVVAFHIAIAQVSPLSVRNNLATIGPALRWGIIPAALVAGLAYWRRDWRIMPPLLWLVASLAVLIRQDPLFAHHTVIIAPCLALLAGLGPAVLRGIRHSPLDIWPDWSKLATTAYTLVVAFVLAGSLVGSKSVLSDAASGPDAQERATLAVINTFAAPGELLVSDDPYAAALTGRSAPPELVDVSSVRIISGDLSTAELERIIERDHITTVVAVTGRFAAAPGFLSWLQSHFVRDAQFRHDPGALVYVRAPSGRGVR
jgi:hypothetical protein